MSKSNHISIVVVTRNKSLELLDCLHSLHRQVLPPDEILVVDNNSTDGTKVSVQKLKRSFIKGTLRYIFEPTVGIPRARNRGLQEAKRSWVIFIDDDCIAPPKWILGMHTSIALHADVAAIIGPSKPYNRINVFSRATAFFYDYWLSQNVKDTIAYNPEILDTKNVALNRRFLQKHVISFDESLVAGEDCDLGIQIEKARGQMIYNPALAVKHKHPTRLRDFLIKHMAYSVSAMQLLTKWPSRQTKLIHKESMTKYFITHRILREKDGWRNISVLPVVFFVAIMNKILFSLYTFRPVHKLLSFPAHKIIYFYLKREPLVH